MLLTSTITIIALAICLVVIWIVVWINPQQIISFDVESQPFTHCIIRNEVEGTFSLQ